MASLNLGPLILSRTRSTALMMAPVPTSSNGDVAVAYYLRLVLDGNRGPSRESCSASTAPSVVNSCPGVAPTGAEADRPPSGIGEGSPPTDCFTVCVPRALLPSVEGRSEDLLVLPMGGEGVGRLLSMVLAHVIDHATSFDETMRLRLFDVVAGLVQAALAEHLHDSSAMEVSTADEGKILDIKKFIEANLGEPLTPTMIAAERYISVRQLHKIFRSSGTTVSGYIRLRRLENWRRDLLSPDNTGLSVHALARRWGLANAAHASRIFTNTYGIGPAAYRTSGGGSPPGVLR